MGLVCGYYCGTAILWRYRGTAVVPANQTHIYRKSNVMYFYIIWAWFAGSTAVPRYFGGIAVPQ